MLKHGLLALSRHSLLCHDRTFSIFNLSMCRDLVCFIATRLLFLALESLSRHRKVFRDLFYLCSADLCVATLRSPSRHRNIGFFCCNQVDSLSKHHMSRPCLSIMTRVSSSFSVATYVALSRYKSFFEAFLLSQQAFPCCHNQCRDIRGFCRDKDFSFCSSLCCNISLSVTVFFLYCSLISCHDIRYLVATEFLPSSCFICSDRSFFVATISSLC